MKSATALRAGLATLCAGGLLAAALPAALAAPSAGPDRSSRVGFTNHFCPGFAYKGAQITHYKIIVAPSAAPLGCAKAKVMLRSYYDHMSPKHYSIGKPFHIAAFPKYGFGPGLGGPFVRSWRSPSTIVFAIGPNHLPPTTDDDPYGDGGRTGLKPPAGTPRGGAPDTTPPASATDPNGPVAPTPLPSGLGEG